MIGTIHSSESAERVRALGAKPVALDLLDARAVRQAVLASEPDAIVHEATALADARFTRNLDRTLRADEPASHRGHGQPARRRARGRRTPLRRPERRDLRQVRA